MSYKVVRNNGALVCFGPNEDGYEPLLKDGEVLTVEDDAPAVAQIISVSAWDLRKALNQTGHRAAVEAVIAAASQDVKDGWATEQTYQRDHPLVEALGVAAGLSDATIDEIFVLANSL